MECEGLQKTRFKPELDKLQESLLIQIAKDLFFIFLLLCSQAKPIYATPSHLITADQTATYVNYKNVFDYKKIPKGITENNTIRSFLSAQKGDSTQIYSEILPTNSNPKLGILDGNFIAVTKGAKGANGPRIVAAGRFLRGVLNGPLTGFNPDGTTAYRVNLENSELTIDWFVDGKKKMSNPFKIQADAQLPQTSFTKLASINSTIIEHLRKDPSLQKVLQKLPTEHTKLKHTLLSELGFSSPDEQASLQSPRKKSSLNLFAYRLEHFVGYAFQKKIKTPAGKDILLNPGNKGDLKDFVRSDPNSERSKERDLREDKKNRKI